MSFCAPSYHASKHMLLQSQCEGNTLHKHRPPRVYTISEVVPLVILMLIHSEVHIWCFSLSTLVVEHVDVIVRPCYPKKAYRIHKSYEATASSMIVKNPMSPLVNHPLHPMGQFLHFQGMQSILSTILEKYSLLPFS